MKKIQTLPEIRWIDLRKLKDKREVILFTSYSLKKYIPILIKNLKILDTIYIKYSDKAYAQNLVKKRFKGEVIYAFGGGRVCDIARYVAKKLNLEIVCVPTIISSDAFLVDSTGLRENGCVKYVSSKKADLVLLDYNLLKQSSKRFHLSGCGDVLSIYTGLFDWKYANEKKRAKPTEQISNSIYKMAQGILEGLMMEENEIKKVSKKALMGIVQALAMEVQLCNLYGNSRPEEGGEHFFTYAIENKLKHFLHGEMVSFGVLLTAFIQGQDVKKIKLFMDSVGLQYIPEGLSRSIVLDTLNQMQAYVKMHKLRYSIYNDLSLEKLNKLQLENFFSLLQLNKNGT